MDFRCEHLTALREARGAYNRSDEEAAPRTGREWVASLGLSDEYELPGIEQHGSKPNRDALFRLAADDRQDTLTICAVIMAWGGMHVCHGKGLFRAGAKWRGVAEEVRFGGISRAKAYSLFHALRVKGALPGMGPAFFTKLVFFLRGKDIFDFGYIMDQWTGCSLNVLTGDPNTVLMNAIYTWTRSMTIRSDFQVSDENGVDRYERFCAAIDRIADEISLPPIDAELLLMSQGRGRGVWRQHVIAHRQPPIMLPK